MSVTVLVAEIAGYYKHTTGVIDKVLAQNDITLGLAPTV